MMKNRRYKGILFFFICSYAFGVVTGGLSVYAEEARSQPGDKETLIRCAIGNDMAGIHDSEVGLKDIQAAWDVWYEEIAKKSGIASPNFFYHDLNSLVKDVNDGKIDLINTTSLNYLRMRPEIAKNMDSDIYGVVRGGSRTHRYLLLVRSDERFSHVRELQNTTLILKKGDDTGRFYLNTLLLKNGQAEADRFFMKIQETRAFSQAILSLFFQKGQACMTTEAVFKTMVELNPQVGWRLKILHTSPEIVNGVFFFHKQIDQKAKEIIVKEVLNLEETTYGQQVLMLYKIDRLIQFKASDLDPMKALLQEYEDLKQKH